MASTRWYQRIAPSASDSADVLGLVSLRSFFFWATRPAPVSTRVLLRGWGVGVKCAPNGTAILATSRR